MNDDQNNNSTHDSTRNNGPDMTETMNEEAPKTISEAEFYRKSRRSFLVGGVTAAATAFGYRGLLNQEAAPGDNIPTTLRSGLEWNEDVWSRLFREGHTAPTYSPSQSSVLRVNGRHGIRSDIDLDAWELQVQGPDGEVWGTHQLSDIQALDRHEMIIEHKCVEGWSQITTWAGARFSDFADLYSDQGAADHKFVSFVTPDEDYFVGFDMPSALHEQTLLAYDMHGGPLDLDHGAPLRLATPLKYGIKHIKRIGSIQFTNEQPADFWASRGYSWYAGL